MSDDPMNNQAGENQVRLNSRAERIAAAWEAATSGEAAEAAPEPTPEPPVTAPEPEITKDTLDEKPEPMAGSIKEFLQKHAGPKEPSGLEKEVQELRAALAQIREAGQPKQEVSEQQELLRELQQLRDREAERLQREEQEKAEREYADREAVLRQGVVTNLQSRKEDYPAIFALGQEENVATELFNRLAQGQDASDFSVASEFEEALVKTYQKLHSVLGNTSEDQPRQSEPKPTLSSSMVGNDSKEDLSQLPRAERIRRAWEKATMNV